MMRRTQKRLLSLLLTCVMLFSLLPAALAADSEDGSGDNVTLDLSVGSIVITANGYRQGIIEYTGTKYSASFTVKNGEDEVNETAYTGSYIITQSNSAATSNGIRIEGVAAGQTVTLNGVNISDPITGSGVVIFNNAAVTLLLAGKNTVMGTSDNPGICVGTNAVLTIDNGEEDGLGKLTAVGSGDSAGIGAADNTNQIPGGSSGVYGSYGSIVINGGEITAKGGSTNYASAGLGSGYNRAAKKVTINGGIVHASGGAAVRALNMEVHGGWLDYAGTTVLVKYDSSANSHVGVVTGGSLTNGLSSYSSGSSVYRRVVLCFGEGDSTHGLLANTEITVYPDENDQDNTWKAYTDPNGVLYAYLPKDAGSVSVRVQGESESRTISLTDESGETVKAALNGIRCVCGENHGTLAMTTPSQSVTTVNDRAALTLEAVYTRSSACLLPGGYGFHGVFEEAPSYEVVSVVRDGQFMTEDRYVSLSGGTAAFYGDVDQAPYTVRLRALIGPEEDPVYSQPIEVTVGTYVSMAKEGELDIGEGSILITNTGYAQGTLTFVNGTGFSVVDEAGDSVTETGWPAQGDHALTVTGTNSGRTANHIVILGGAPTITLKNVTMTVSGAPAIALVNGADTSSTNTATLVLEGSNSLAGGFAGGGNWPGILINRYARLTIEGNGELSAAGNGNAAPGIGTSGNGNSPYAINRSGNTYNNNMRSDGELVINGGVITASYTAGTAALGTANDNAQLYLGKVTINGGKVICRTTGNGRGIFAKDIAVTGGQIHVEAANGNQSTNGIEAKSGAFSMSGGTITMGRSAAEAIKGQTGVSITGGNINGYYTGEEANSRVLTTLYFVEGDGAPVAETEVTVTEDGHTWTALTNAEGRIITYFAGDTSSVTVSYGDETNVSVELKDGQALIGGDCTCSDFSGITWDTGLPAAVTLYGDQDIIYTLAAAELSGGCPMPIHPNLPAITYSLSVSKDGSPVGKDDAASYATLEGGVLTLKPANAPYTVTLTAGAGDKTAPETLEVKAGAADGDIIDLSAETDNARTLDSDTTAIVTGNAANGSVEVADGTAVLTLNQDSADNVWIVTAGENAAAVTLNAQTVEGKVRFGNAKDLQAVQGYLSAVKVKLNPDAGNITFNADGSVTQGRFTLTGLGDREIAVMGADAEAARSITNSSGSTLTLKINGETVTLADAEVYTVGKALGSEMSRSGASVTYVMEGGKTIYEHYTEADGKRTYGLCGYSSTAPSNQVEGYRLLIVAEGDAGSDTRGYMDKVLFDTGEDEYDMYYTQSRITDAVVDEDITGTLYASGLLYDTNLKELHAESVGDIVVYAETLGEIYFGDNLSRFTWGDYCSVAGVHVPETNPYFAVDGGVLYTKDFSTLLLIPSGLKGSYTVREECTRINANATMSCGLDSFTVGRNVSYIGGTYIFYNNRVGEFQVAAGNQYFAPKDGVLYSAGFTKMVAYPRRKTDTSLTVPDTLTYVEPLVLNGTPIRTLTVPKGASVTGDANGFGGMTSLEEVVLEGGYAGRFDGAVNMKKLTVPDGFNFSQNLATCSMDWIKSAGITVSGGGSVPYDGLAYPGVTVTTTAADCTMAYSTDGETYSETAPTFTDPGAYTVYWKITKAADDAYAFPRELSSSRTFTITELEASEDWFALTVEKPADAADWTPVELELPSGAPSLENGYTVKYSKGGTEEATQTIPTEAGRYLVTVEITAQGYVNETLTLGYYVVREADQGSDVILSFITNGGAAIEPILAAADSEITRPADPTRNGYTFGGWYTDAALRSAVETFPEKMPSENTTYYAKWLRENYTITYEGLEGAAENPNPTKYHVESAGFDLTAPSRPGYTFLGWTWDGQTEPQGEVTIPRGSYGNRTYTANWEKIEYEITYPDAYDVVDTNPTSYTVDSTSSAGIALTAPAAREGYAFSGWAMNVEGVVSILPAENAMIPQGTLGNITLTGIWLAQDQTLTLNANGGKFTDGSEVMTITAEYASTLNLTEPVRNYYDFAGWYADQACTTPFTAANMPVTTTIYAKWTATEYAITYLGMEEAGTENTNPAVYTVEGPEITLTAPSRPGYTFLGWTWEGQTTPQPQASIPAGSSGAKTFTANWQAVSSGGSGGGSVTYAVIAESGGHGSVTVSPKTASGGRTVTVTVKADEGYALASLTVTDRNGKELELTKKSDTQYTFTMPASRVSVQASFVQASEPTAELPYTDVADDAYYYDAVAWAVEKGVTNGITATTFGPGIGCTRAQVVTFLWRAEGSPKATGANPFTDVEPGMYYYDAVLWAVEKGITTGTGDGTTFSPDAVCSRAQFVTFLWRAEGSPKATGANMFTDVEPGVYYYDAVLWAVEKSVTNGTGGGVFSPDDSCTRAQIVTFLYRCMAE